MMAVSARTRAAWIVGPALLVLSGCKQASSPDETAWARAALERNPAIEVVAQDAKGETFTVRDKATGELRTVRANEVVAAVPGTAASTSPAPAAAQPAPAPAPSEAPAAPGESAASAAAEEPAGAEAMPQEQTAEPSDTPRVAESSTGGEAAAPPAGGGRVIASGPGYSIQVAEPGSGPTTAPAPSASRFAPGVPVERRSEPLVCQGSRLMHIDNKNLEFAGDAVTAEDGCEIHITNSHIVAGGVGVSARAANVHIKNSSIEGETGSVSASDGAQVYARSSTFKGLSRRLDTAELHDLGGNVWN